MSAVLNIFSNAIDFMPHGYCFLWDPYLLWTYVISDFIIFVSYFSIPFCLLYFISKRPDLPFKSTFVLFGLFVLACGATHLMGIITIWSANYWLDAGIKLFTAIISAVAAILLWHLLPAALSLPSRREVVIANEWLKSEITKRSETEAELKRTNEALKARTAELETANRELDSFAYAVSHDLRGPLRAMRGFSQALTEDVAGKLDENEIVYLEHITKASEEMGQLIDGLLTLSRHVRSEIQTDSIDISGIAEKLCRDIARDHSDHQAKVSIEPGISASGDRRLISVVLTNLLVNAWKYTANTPDAEISVTTHEDDGKLWISVTDNGAGFDMAHADRLFLPFQRLHRHDEFPGIGIGLATVQRIIHRHGGQIRAMGHVGQGAQFSFFLPPSPCSPLSEAAS